MPPDQPRPEAKPTREHREAAYVHWFGSNDVSLNKLTWYWVETGAVTTGAVGRVVELAALLASRDAAAEERGRRLEREAVIRFLNAQPTGVSLPSCAQAIGSEVHLATPAAPETKT